MRVGQSGSESRTIRGARAGPPPRRGNGEKGTVVLSIDAELAWGFHDLDRLPERRIHAAPDAWYTLVSLLEEYDLPATWAIVGHLFLPECDGTHADHPLSPGWFERDPGSETGRPAWFGRDLIDAVLDAKVDHEVASHSFSHVEFGHSETTREVAATEVGASIDAAADLGLSLRSFVFPRNDVGHRDVLAAYGFESYRGTRPGRWYDDVPAPRLGKLVDAALVRSPPPLVAPEPDEYGLVDVPASLCLFGFEGLVRSLVEPVGGDPVVRQAKLGIDDAVRSGGVFHLWLHPNDLVGKRERERLRRVLSYLARRRADADLTVKTMAEVAAEARP
ncbi:polysaccharide deacetylase family protein [Natronorarus salvus]|uniref:polysaccharide deacetylase n=1 Tax=Natronorarus salvus TaxID=3117733 RepID=UPI002F263CB7